LNAPELLQCTAVCKRWNSFLSSTRRVKEARGALERWQLVMNMRRTELLFTVPQCSVPQPELGMGMRAILADWLVQVNEEFENSLETLHLALRLIDCFLSRVRIPRAKMQLVGITGLLVASKTEEQCYPDLQELVYLCDGEYERSELLEMESIMLRAMDHRVHAPTTLIYLNYLLEEFAPRVLPRLAQSLCRYLADLMLMDFTYVQCRPSVLAAAIFCLVSYLFSIQFHDVLFYMRCAPRDLVPSSTRIIAMLLSASTDPLQHVYGKYCADAFHRVACIDWANQANHAHYAAYLQYLHTTPCYVYAALGQAHCEPGFRLRMKLRRKALNKAAKKAAESSRLSLSSPSSSSSSSSSSSPLTPMSQASSHASYQRRPAVTTPAAASSSQLEFYNNRRGAEAKEQPRVVSPPIVTGATPSKEIPSFLQSPFVKALPYTQFELSSRSMLRIIYQYEQAVHREQRLADEEEHARRELAHNTLLSPSLMLQLSPDGGSDSMMLPPAAAASTPLGPLAVSTAVSAANHDVLRDMLAQERQRQRSHHQQLSTALRNRRRTAAAAAANMVFGQQPLPPNINNNVAMVIDFDGIHDSLQDDDDDDDDANMSDAL
jgi:hypothetical protein